MGDLSEGILRRVEMVIYISFDGIVRNYSTNKL